MRTNRNGVTETAHIRTDLEKYGNEHERIFGKDEKKVWCDDCGKRLTMCECKKEEEGHNGKDN